MSILNINYFINTNNILYIFLNIYILNCIKLKPYGYINNINITYNTVIKVNSRIYNKKYIIFKSLRSVNCFSSRNCYFYSAKCNKLNF